MTTKNTPQQTLFRPRLRCVVHPDCAVASDQLAIEKALQFLVDRTRTGDGGLSRIHADKGAAIAALLNTGHLYRQDLLRDAHRIATRYLRTQLEPEGLFLPDEVPQVPALLSAPAPAAPAAPALDAPLAAGVVSKVIIPPAANGYAVFVLRDEGGAEVRCAGSVPGAQGGTDLVGWRLAVPAGAGAWEAPGRLRAQTVEVLPSAAQAQSQSQRTILSQGSARGPLPEDAAKVTGVVGRILVPPKSDTGWCMFRLERAVVNDGRPAIVVAKGIVTSLTQGQEVELTGRWSMGRAYNGFPAEPEFNFTMMTAAVARTEEGLAKWIVGLKVDGVADATAHRIVAFFLDSGLKPDEVFNALADKPELILTVPRLPASKLAALAEKVSASLRDTRAEQEARSKLLSWGLTPGQVSKALVAYGVTRVLDVVTMNPYDLARTVPGIGFKIVDDKIAPAVGVAKDSLYRLKAGVVYALEQARSEGHCYLESQPLAEAAVRLLNVEGALVTNAMAMLCEDQDAPCVVEEDRFYLASLHRAEAGLAQRILERLSQREGRPATEQEVLSAERQRNTTLSEEQRDAVRLLSGVNFGILTGGPGRGKSKVCQILADVLEARGRKLAFGAPTGKAARVLGDATRRQASTIHRLIGIGLDNKSLGSESGLDDVNAFVCDESSMMDLPLTDSVLRRYKGGQLFFVGDVDQLPSVGPGRVLRDLIESGRVPVARLTKVFRQAAGSEIIQGANAMLDGKVPQCSGWSGMPYAGQLAMVEQDDSALINEQVYAILQQAHTQGIALDECLVLSPRRGGGALDDPGVNGLNAFLQARYNPNGAPVKVGNKVLELRVGDRVIETKNKYGSLDVRNGDVGTIRRVAYEGDARGLTVAFDYGREVIYPFDQIAGLELGYALTVHKSQGSQARFVVLVWRMDHMMCRRELLYTAVTRGKDAVVIVGSRKALAVAVADERREPRNTYLAQRLGAY